MIRTFIAQPVKILHFKSLLTRKQARWPHFFIAFLYCIFIMFISWICITLSFKKSLIVEQFQGNYLKAIWLKTDVRPNWNSEPCYHFHGWGKTTYDQRNKNHIEPYWKTSGEALYLLCSYPRWMPPPVVPAVMHDKAPSKRGPYDDTTQEEAYPLIRHHPRGGAFLKNESLGWLLHAF